MAIVLPDGLLGNSKEGYVRQFIRKHADIVGIIDLPLETFMPSTSTKTSILVVRKTTTNSTQREIFLAKAYRCGHDRRGKPLLRPDGSEDEHFTEITANFAAWKHENAPDF
jgi:type I restriction enzyme M protein